MRYCMYLLSGGEIAEGSILQEEENSLTMGGIKHHVDLQKDDILALQQAVISSQGMVLSKSRFELKKKDILEQILEMNLNQETQHWVEPEFVSDDNASMGVGYYNKLTGRRLLKIKSNIKPFSGCTVEVIEAVMESNIPYATVRIFQDNNSYEGLSYQVDTELEEFSPQN